MVRRIPVVAVVLAGLFASSAAAAPPNARAARPPRQSANLLEPNACDGVGAGAGADAADSSSAVSLLLPAGFPVLFQVGRRGPAGAAADEPATVALETTDVTLASPP